MLKSKCIVILVLIFSIRTATYSQENTCNINYLILQEINNLNFNLTNHYDSLQNLLRLNLPNDKVNCYFPNTETQSKILYSFIDSSVIRSKLNLEAQRFLIELYLNEKHNIELIEYLNFKVPYSIFNNLYSYLMIYESLNEDQREQVNQTFIYLTNNQDYKSLIGKLESISINTKRLKEGIILNINK